MILDSASATSLSANWTGFDNMPGLCAGKDQTQGLIHPKQTFSIPIGIHLQPDVGDPSVCCDYH